METKKIIDLVESKIKDPAQGLPEDIFLFISGVTPLVNVDLLIKNQQQQTLLTWRDDIYSSTGWHVPGGVVRFKERFADRLKAVAAYELGAEIKFKPEPVALNQLIIPKRRTRGHFISLLYECELTGSLDEKLKFKPDKPQVGAWAWHSQCPANLIPIQDVYRKFI